MKNIFLCVSMAAWVLMASHVWAEKHDDNGLFLSDEVDKKAYVEKLEAQYYAMSEKNDALARQVKELSDRMGDDARMRSKMNDMVSALEARVNGVITQAAQAADGRLSGVNAPFDAGRYDLNMIKVAPVELQEEGLVYLPAGSFVRATLLTGVYAPADQGNPLPVLLRLNEAFVGPNEASIPLEGSFVIGKAAGDLTSERALVQITTLSSVLPSGTAFEKQGNLGYVTDGMGQLGLKGVVVRNTGAQMAMSFMTGFMGGASKAIAEGETTVVSSTRSGTRRNVTGDVGKYAGFQGLSESASRLSDYYAAQLDKMVPAIKVDAGVDAYFIVMEGMNVYGLKRDLVSRGTYLD
ncbi:MAG: hypothetical protein HQL19_07235 [Candidatus Omnitrophica bacterium]|nr:hypothetical protein [Candidatus Omnitrophota bacterium]